MDPNEPETHGIMIRPLTLYCTDGELRTRVWDFGGQHVLHAIMAEGAGFEPTDPAAGLSMISADGVGPFDRTLQLGERLGILW
jgi:hypothetical protein